MKLKINDIGSYKMWKSQQGMYKIPLLSVTHYAIVREKHSLCHQFPEVSIRRDPPITFLAVYTAQGAKRDPWHTGTHHFPSLYPLNFLYMHLPSTQSHTFAREQLPTA